MAGQKIVLAPLSAQRWCKMDPRTDNSKLNLIRKIFNVDLTNEQIESEFKRQVRLCSGVGEKRMLEIVTEQFGSQVTYFPELVEGDPVGIRITKAMQHMMTAGKKTNPKQEAARQVGIRQMYDAMMRVIAEIAEPEGDKTLEDKAPDLSKLKGRGGRL